MVHVYVTLSVCYMWLAVSSALWILNDHLDCNQQGISCISHIVNCSDEPQRVPRRLAPTGPEWALESLGVGEAENGLLPVINVSWSVQTNVGIYSIQGARVHLSDDKTSQSLCVHYAFKIPSQLNPSTHYSRWTFSLDGAVVEPGHTYSISVFHLPEPDQKHYRIQKQITVPRCDDRRIQKSQLCLENGSTWSPQMMVWVSWGPSSLRATVSFNASLFSDTYTVSAHSPAYHDSHNISKGKRTWLNITFELDVRKHIQISPKCDISFVVQPFFPGCQNKCLSFKKKIGNCPYHSKKLPYALLIETTLGLIIICGYISYNLWKTSYKDPGTVTPPDTTPEGVEVPEGRRRRRRVLLIYSPDHPLYTAVVLRLSSFLMAECGTDVVLDLLDSAGLGRLGGVRWLDWHREQILEPSSSSDKILILCSRGVQAKWRAMSAGGGGGGVVLRQDLCSPTGDLLSPALGLIVPGLVRAASLHRYIVAYFEGVCSEEDVPEPLRVAVRYRLMEQFEEVFFRILDVERQRPGRLNRAQGLGRHEYALCPSGEALRVAVEAFRAHQWQNPHWFQEELVEEESEGRVGSDDAGHTLLDTHTETSHTF